jgi:uncharacterized protein (UPF0335 family)
MSEIIIKINCQEQYKRNLHKEIDEIFGDIVTVFVSVGCILKGVRHIAAIRGNAQSTPLPGIHGNTLNMRNRVLPQKS